MPITGRLLAVASVIPAVLAASWLLASFPLLLGRAFYPAAVVPLFAVVAAVLLWRAWPAVRERALRWDAVPAWVVLAVLVIVVGFAVISYVTSSQHVIIRRDPGTYAVTTTWLAQHGYLDAPTPYTTFGGSAQAGDPPGIGFASQGFYHVGAEIVPQFLSGAPAVFSIGYWVAGVGGILHANAFIGALSLLAFAGLVARLVGPRWAPLGTLALALALPQWHTSRTTLSEPLTQLLLLGGLAMLLDAVAHRAAGTHRSFGVAGLLLGLTFMVRIDALAALLPLGPFIAWLWLRPGRGGRGAAWFTGGIAVGLAVGAIDGAVLSTPYVSANTGNIALVGGVLVAVAVVSAAVAWLVHTRPAWLHDGGRDGGHGGGHGGGRGRAWRHTVRRRGPDVVAAGVVVAGALLALRPFLYTSHTNNAPAVATMITSAQAAEGSPIDPNRTYYEHSTTWLAWWVGWAAFALAVLAAAWLARDVLRGRRLQWLPVLLVMCVTTVLVLLRPSITPDHPWADRRFTPVAVPAVALLATAAVAAATRWAQRRTGHLGVAGLVATAGVAVLVAPPAIASAPLLMLGTEQHEVALVQRVCAQLRPDDAVLMVGGRTRAEWTTTLSVFCKVPTAWLRDGEGADPADQVAAVNAAAQSARADGRRLVLMTSEMDPQGKLALDSRLPVDWGAPVAQLSTYQDAHTLERRPHRRVGLDFSVWLVRVPPSGLPSE